MCIDRCIALCLPIYPIYHHIRYIDIDRLVYIYLYLSICMYVDRDIANMPSCL